MQCLTSRKEAGGAGHRSEEAKLTCCSVLKKLADERFLSSRLDRLLIRECQAFGGTRQVLSRLLGHRFIHLSRLPSWQPYQPYLSRLSGCPTRLIDLVPLSASVLASRASLLPLVILLSIDLMIVFSCFPYSLLLFQVVPDPLLDFCFNVMRSAFSVTLNRPVYAFKFDRFMEVTPAILEKVVLCVAGVSPLG